MLSLQVLKIGSYSFACFKCRVFSFNLTFAMRCSKIFPYPNLICYSIECWLILFQASWRHNWEILELFLYKFEFAVTTSYLIPPCEFCIHLLDIHWDKLVFSVDLCFPVVSIRYGCGYDTASIRIGTGNDVSLTFLLWWPRDMALIQNQYTKDTVKIQIGVSLNLFEHLCGLCENHKQYGVKM